MEKADLVVATLIALLAGGLISIVKALQWEWRIVRRARNGCVTEGEVVDLVDVGGSPDEPFFRTIVEFTDRRGQRHRIQSKWSESPAQYRVGQAVRVSYEEDDPGAGDIVNRSLGIWLGGLGLLLTFIATVLLRDMLKYGLEAH